MGRERFELSTTAVSRQYPNQLDHRPVSFKNYCGLLTFNVKNMAWYRPLVRISKYAI